MLRTFAGSFIPQIFKRLSLQKWPGRFRIETKNRVSFCVAKGLYDKLQLLLALAFKLFSLGLKLTLTDSTSLTPDHTVLR